MNHFWRKGIGLTFLLEPLRKTRTTTSTVIYLYVVGKICSQAKPVRNVRRVTVVSSFPYNRILCMMPAFSLWNT